MHRRSFEPSAPAFPAEVALAPVLLCSLLEACSSGGGGGGSPGEPPASLDFERVGGQFTMPVLATAPAGDPRLFVVEKGGTVRIVENDAQTPTPFLDVTPLVSSGQEQGLLGMAFDPSFASNRRFYVDYTDHSGDTVVARYRVSAGDPDRADPSSAEILLTVERPDTFHNGGMIAFGPDGFLYVALGDGGDPLDTGQNVSDLLGSVLRIDVSGSSGYVIPPDNPFAGGGGAPEVWSFGLRNPWRFSFDRHTGDLYIGDVGQAGSEEIDVARASSGGGRAANYGWSILEGSLCYLPPIGCDRADMDLPVHEYATHVDGCSVIGGYVYRGAAVPGLHGAYFYGDYCGGWVKSFRLTNGQATEHRNWEGFPPGNTITSFGEDGAGELYVMTGAGGVYRIAPGAVSAASR